MNSEKRDRIAELCGWKQVEPGYWQRVNHHGLLVRDGRPNESREHPIAPDSFDALLAVWKEHLPKIDWTRDVHRWTAFHGVYTVIAHTPDTDNIIADFTRLTLAVLKAALAAKAKEGVDRGE